MVQEIKTRSIPEYALIEISKMPFENRERFCNVYIAEQDAVTFIDPESFDLCEVYGNCELRQIVVGEQMGPIHVCKWELTKDQRSFEEEAARMAMSNVSSHDP